MITKRLVYSYNYILDNKNESQINKLRGKLNQMDLDLENLRTTNENYRMNYYSKYLIRKRKWEDRLTELIEKENKKINYWINNGFRGSALKTL